VANTVTWEALRELAGFRAQNGCAVSLYLNLDPSVAPTAPDAQTRINSLLAKGERLLDSSRGSLTHDQRSGLKGDLGRIARWFDDEFDRDGAHGLAVFAAGLDNMWRELDVTAPVPDELRVGSELYLAPLVPLVGRGEGALVAVVGREQGQVYRLRGGRLESLADETEEQPGQHDQGGWSQANYQRHIDNLVAEHLRRVADRLDELVRRNRGSRLVIVCSEEMRSDFADLLSHEVKSAKAGWASAEAHATPGDLLAVAQPVLEEWRAKREGETLERWREEAGRNGRASAGWAATLEAASDGRVDLLLVQEGTDRDAYRCPACGRAQMTDGTCPLDGTTMERSEAGLDIAVHQTLAHGGAVHVVRARRDLEPVEGIGALLRY
jgi:peptide chain release factor subunit 1